MPIIKVSIENAVEHGCDVGVVIKGIILGAFRSSDTVRQEAHKTIDHLVQLILKDSVNAGADPEVAVQAIIKGVIEIAREERLNEEEALSEAGTSVVLAAYTLGSDVESKVREVLSNDFAGHKVELKEEYLKKQKTERFS
jgi:cation transport ATPase